MSPPPQKSLPPMLLSSQESALSRRGAGRGSLSGATATPSCSRRTSGLKPPSTACAWVRSITHPYGPPDSLHFCFLSVIIGFTTYCWLAESSVGTKTWAVCGSPRPGLRNTAMPGCTNRWWFWDANERKPFWTVWGNQSCQREPTLKQVEQADSTEWDSTPWCRLLTLPVSVVFRLISSLDPRTIILCYFVDEPDDFNIQRFYIHCITHNKIMLVTSKADTTESTGQVRLKSKVWTHLFIKRFNWISHFILEYL